MKKLFTILSIVALGFTACEGDPGPQGPPGVDGLDAEYSKVVEVETTLSYNSDSGIWESPIIEFPSNVISASRKHMNINIAAWDLVLYHL